MITSDNPPPQNPPPPIVTDPGILQKTLFDDFVQSVLANGEMVMPCIPALTDYYIWRIGALFQAIDSRFSQEQLQQVGPMIAKNLVEGFRISPHSRLRLKYETSQPTNEGYKFKTSILAASVVEEYQKWVDSRQPLLFGSEPNAKVMQVAAQFEDPTTVTVLDVGAQIGRHTLPLARQGYSVDALELSPTFVERLKNAASTGSVNVTVGDILDPLVRMPLAHYRFAIGVEVIAAHCRDVEQLRLFLVKMCDVLCSGGLLLFAIFLCQDDYEPDPLTRQLSQLHWSSFFTQQDLASAMEGLPLQLISNESFLDYEREHQSPETGTLSEQFCNWATGGNILVPSTEKSVVELRWILGQRI
jgi:hypothetical protein